MFTLVSQILKGSGLLGLALLMLVENLIPIIPSEAILPVAGVAAARGEFGFLGAVVASTVGSVLGGYAWYVFGRRVGLERFKALPPRWARWLTFSRSDLERGEAWFARWGGPVVAVGRALPGIRGYICIPAGMAGLRPLSFLIWSTLGAFVWSVLMIGAGAFLEGRYDQVDRWLNPATDALLAIGVITYGVRLVTWKAHD